MTETLAASATSLSLLWGSVDSYNSLVTGATTITGADIQSAIAGIYPGQTSVFVTISGLPSFTSVTYLSTLAPSFEFVPATTVSTIPEPVSLALLAAGLVAMGAARRTRR